MARVQRLLSSIATLLLFTWKTCIFSAVFFFLGCQQLPPSVRLLLTNIDWAVSDFLAGCAPLHRQPHLSALLLSLLRASAHCSRSGLWPGRDFLTAYACAHRAERFVWKSWKKKWRKGKEEIGSICICMCLFVSAVGLHMNRYLSFFCCCPASINSSFPVQSNPRVLVLVGLFLPSASSPTFTLSRPAPVCLYIRQTAYYRASSLLTGNFLWCRSGTVHNRVFFPPFLHHICNPAALFSLCLTVDYFMVPCLFYLWSIDVECFFLYFALFIFQIKCETLHMISIYTKITSAWLTFVLCTFSKIKVTYNIAFNTWQRLNHTFLHKFSETLFAFYTYTGSYEHLSRAQLGIKLHVKSAPGPNTVEPDSAF